MKKIIKVGVCGLITAMFITGCTTSEAKNGKTNEINLATTNDASNESNIKLGEYKGVEYTPLETVITDDEVEEEIKSLLSMYPNQLEVDRAAAEGDIVNIDYVGLKDDVAFEGGTAVGYDLTLGSGSFIPGFEDGLIGTAAGQEVSLNLTFPEYYGNEELAGQEVVFEVKVNTVTEETEAELNDEFIKAHTDSKTVNEYRIQVKTWLTEYAEEMALNQKKSDVFLKVVEDSEVTVASADVDAYYEEQMALYAEQSAMYGMDLETMLSFSGMTLEMFEEEMKEMAQQAMEQNAVVDAIAKAEGLAVTDADRKALAEEFGYESVESMQEQAGASVVDNYILTEKVVELIADHAIAV